MTYLYERVLFLTDKKYLRSFAQDTMLSSPSLSSIFAPRTNTLHSLLPRQTTHLPKRQLLHDTIKPQKRLKLDLDTENNVEESDGEEEEDAYMEPQEVARLRARQNTRSYNIFSRFTTNPSMSFRKPARTCYSFSNFIPPTWHFLASTLPILKSFVSSNKSDLFKCQSIGEDTYLTPPYACAFSHGKLLYPHHSSSYF